MNISKFQILSSSSIAFDCEFYTDKGIEKVSKDLDSSYTVTEEKDGKISVLTTYMCYTTAKVELAKLLNYINENGSTNDKCKMKTFVTFDKDKCDVSLYMLNICKFILAFDEELNYRLFPNRKRKLGARSIYSIFPSTVPEANSTLYNHYDNYSVVCSTIYGVDFSRLKDNTIIYQYTGGREYEKKYQEISYLIDYYIVNLYTSVTEPAFTVDEAAKLSELSKKYKSVITAFSSYNEFKLKFKDIRIMVDLCDIDGRESIFWNLIKDKLYGIMIAAQLFDNKEITINYDTDSSAYQIKDATIYDVVNLNGVDLINCKVSGTMSNCNLFSCDVYNSEINYSTIFGSTMINGSTLSSVYLSDAIDCKGSYIYGDSTISGTYEDCVIGNGVKYTDGTDFKKCSKKNIVKIN